MSIPRQPLHIPYDIRYKCMINFNDKVSGQNGIFFISLRLQFAPIGPAVKKNYLIFLVNNSSLTSE